MGEGKAKFNLNQQLPLMEQERTMCINIWRLLPSKWHMLEESPLFTHLLALASHKRDCFEEIMAKQLATIKGDFKFLSSIQNLEENILELNDYEEEVSSKMDDWSNGSTSTFPMSLAGL